MSSTTEQAGIIGAAGAAGSSGGSGGDRELSLEGGGKSRGARSGRVLGILTGSAAVIPILALGAMMVVLAVEAIPAIKYNGFGFFSSSNWDVGSLYSYPVKTGGVTHLVGAHYGAFSIVVGTILSSAIAIAVGFPIAYGSAVIVAERLPRRLAGALGTCLEVLAGIPSVVFGLWGVLVFGPILARDVYPAIARHAPDVPILRWFRGPVGTGEGLLTAGLVLGVMIVPIIAATTRDLLRQVPVDPKEGAEALGMTRREVYKTVQSRWIRSGVIGAAVLGLGRALGETIAIAMVSGSQIRTPSNIYDTMTTIAATIVNQLDAALIDPTKLAVRSLAEAALVLLVISVICNVAARLMVRRAAQGAALPVGAGL